MKKIMLFLWLILLLSQSCYDDRLEVGSKDMMLFIPFGIEDARQYFENNARDLSPLSFEEASETKSLDQTVADLYPKWDNAMLSGHRGVSLIEVPLGSTTVAFAREYTVWKGSVVGSREIVSGRRLVIAKRSDGAVDMFVITIVPNVSATQSEMVRMVDEFRYLGGGTFSGKVFCSTLEGQFVKALGYTDGELNGTLPTRVRNNTEPVDSLESYTRVTFSEEAVAKASMFSSIEGGGDGGGIDYGRCFHGYTKGLCPYGCDAEIGGVDIVVCPDCRMQNGCVCLKCFYCGKKEKNCTCTRCTRCRKKVQQCTCYLYPDPDKPVTPGGGGVGGDNSDISHNQDIFDLVFPNSKLTAQQRQKVKESLDRINQDYLGRKLINEVKKKAIAIVHDSTMKENGKYNHDKNKLFIKNFNEGDTKNRNLEKTLLHELLHSVQSGDLGSKMNQEIEVRFIVWRYANKHKIPSRFEIDPSALQYAVDENYDITDKELFDSLYQSIITQCQKSEYYKKYPEDPSKRNMNTVKYLIDKK